MFYLFLNQIQRKQCCRNRVDKTKYPIRPCCEELTSSDRRDDKNLDSFPASLKSTLKQDDGQTSQLVPLHVLLKVNVCFLNDEISRKLGSTQVL